MRWWHGLNSMLFMRCRDAASLISQGTDRRLPLEDNAALVVHLAICPSCRRYRGQLALLKRVLRLVALRPPDSENVGPLPPDARARIGVALECHGNER